jgi:CDP-diacylglycerol--serine O-phosphatidyltransferase
MVSRIPMMAMKFKGISVKNDWPKLLLIVVAIIAGIFIKWLAVPLVFIIYLFTSMAMPAYARGEKNEEV